MKLNKLARYYNKKVKFLEEIRKKRKTCTKSDDASSACL